MRCPFCYFEETKVTDSRSAQEANVIRRRRECLKCLKRFTTFETVDLTLQVHKRDGTFEDFKEEKLIKGLDAACCRSKISHDQVLNLVNKIKAELMTRQLEVISAKELGEMVMRNLKEMDIIAYIRFACVYKRLTSLDELMDAIRSIGYAFEKK